MMLQYGNISQKKMQCYFTYSIYIGSKDILLKLISHTVLFSEWHKRVLESSVLGKFVKGWRIEKNNSNLKGRRERIEQKDELKEQTHHVQRRYYPATAKLKDGLSHGTRKFNNLFRVFYCHLHKMSTIKSKHYQK